MQEYGIKYIELKNWTDYSTKIVRNIAALENSLIFRGQQKSKWELTSSLTRILQKKREGSGFNQLLNDKYFGSINKYVENHLSNYFMASRGKRGQNPQKIEESEELWSLGQHYGLATPLLDWSNSPYVALFFAFEEDVSESQENGYRTIFALNSCALMAIQVREGLERTDWVNIIESYADDNQRLVNQSAKFTLLKSDYLISIEDWIKKYNKKSEKETVLYKINIPDIDRLECLRELNRMNINYLTLFPDLFGAAKHSNFKMIIENY